MVNHYCHHLLTEEFTLWCQWTLPGQMVASCPAKQSGCSLMNTIRKKRLLTVHADRDRCWSITPWFGTTARTKRMGSGSRAYRKEVTIIDTVSLPSDWYSTNQLWLWWTKLNPKEVPDWWKTIHVKTEFTPKDSNGYLQLIAFGSSNINSIDVNVFSFPWETKLLPWDLVEKDR